MVSSCRSPSQTKDEFNDCSVNFEQLFSDIISLTLSSLLITVNVNVRTSTWWRKDITTLDGTQLEAHTCSYELNQPFFSRAHICQS